MRAPWLTLMLLAVAHAPDIQAQSHQAGSWREEIRRLRAAFHGRRQPLTRLPMAGGTSQATVVETEPNETTATADQVVLGQRAMGLINPSGDEDFWSVDLVAGQHFSVDVDAFQVGSPLDATLTLFAPDGQTLLAFNDDFDGFDSRISFRIETSGRYFVRIRAFALAGNPAFTYAINFGIVTCTGFGDEQEPNDSPATARRITLGRSGSGEICPQDDNPAGDVDYWAFPVAAGTTIELDIDVVEFGVLSEPVLILFAGDGVTRLASSEDPGQPESRLQHRITIAGTYFVRVASLTDPGGRPFPYILHFRGLAQGPGDPITVHASDVGLPLGLAVGPTGDLFVGDVAGNRIRRVSAQGGVTTFADGIQSPEGLAFDSFGFLLVVSGDGVVYRVSPSGESTRFITDAGVPFWIAVGPDGRIWLTDLLELSLRRYSPTGRFEEKFAADVGGLGPGPLAIAPSGEPHFSSGNEVWKLANGNLQRVIADPQIIWAFAFDVTGNIYAPMPVAGHITLFGPGGNRLVDPFSVGADTPQAVAFGRDATGATVARLFATDFGSGRVIELNPAGIANPGQPAGFLAPFTIDAAAAALLGPGSLTEADRQFLDALGNRNGRYDVGDLQAYLRALGDLGGLTAVPATTRKAAS